MPDDFGVIGFFLLGIGVTLVALVLSVRFVLFAAARCGPTCAVVTLGLVLVVVGLVVMEVFGPPAPP